MEERTNAAFAAGVLAVVAGGITFYCVVTFQMFALDQGFGAASLAAAVPALIGSGLGATVGFWRTLRAEQS